MNDLEIYDYINILFKRRKLIIVVLTFFVLVSIILNIFVLPKIYSGSCGLLLPMVGETKIIDAEDVSLIVHNRDFLLPIATECGIKYEDIKDNIGVKTSGNSIVISVEYKDRKKITCFLYTITESLNEYIEPIYNKKIETLKNKLKTLDEQIKSLETVKNEIYEELKVISKRAKENHDLYMEYSLTHSTYNLILNKIISLENEKTKYEGYLQGSRRFVFLYAPYSPEIPVKPKVLFNILVTAILGFIVSVLICFTLEFVFKK